MPEKKKNRSIDPAAIEILERADALAAERGVIRMLVMPARYARGLPREFRAVAGGRVQ